MILISILKIVPTSENMTKAKTFSLFCFINNHLSFVTLEECIQKAWNVLRSQYLREKISKKGKSGDAGGKVKFWRFFQALSFLNDVTSTRETKSNLVLVSSFSVIFFK